MPHGYWCNCRRCLSGGPVDSGRRRGGRRAYTSPEARERELAEWEAEKAAREGGTMNATAFLDKPQRDDPTITNTFFNGPGDGKSHGHVKHRDNQDGTTDYLYARDVEGNEYDV